MENSELECRKTIKTNSTSLAVSNYQNTPAHNKINAFSHQTVSASNGLAIETLMKKTCSWSRGKSFYFS